MSSEKPASTAGVKERDPDFINAEIALKRAARKAHELARQAGVGVIVLQDGEIMVYGRSQYRSLRHNTAAASDRPKAVIGQ